MNNNKQGFPLPSDLVNSARAKTEQIAKEHQERVKKVVKKLLDIMIEEGVIITELPIIVQLLTDRVNSHINGAKIRQILELNKPKQ